MRALVLASLFGCGQAVVQPIDYNHAVHVGKLEMVCDACHEGSTSGVTAGLPVLSDCADCHREPNSSSAAEKKIVQAVAADRPLAWQRLYRLPEHVFFTHRRHVEVANIACERCHGRMRDQKRPPPAALMALQMDDCIACHKERGVATDCTTCHR